MILATNRRKRISQTDRVKKVGAKVTGKDGSVWEFSDRNGCQNL
ncbi:MAG: hypothetical protein WA865_04070 [Spirulinaceae cyanobacterium]